MFSVPIPGGTCVVRTADEMTVKHRRAVALRIHLFGRDRFLNVVGLAVEADTLEAEAIGVTPTEETALEEISDVVSWALLDGWTLPDPVPDSPGAVGGLSGELRAAVADAVADEGNRAIKGVLGLGENSP